MSEINYTMNEFPEIRDGFDDGDFKRNVTFIPLPQLEKLVSEIIKDIDPDKPI